VVSKPRITAEGKAQADSKAQHTRQYVSISRGLQRRHRVSRQGYETTDHERLWRKLYKRWQSVGRHGLVIQTQAAVDMSVSEMIAAFEGYLKQGMMGVKMKIGHEDPKIDIKRVDEVRKALGGDAWIAVDANQKRHYRNGQSGHHG
jgi:L-alanine-DL-glutamate epimerase-like enolase superfamily enzyme